MSPTINAEDPIEKAKWQAAYAEGFEAGKRYTQREVEEALRRAKSVKAFQTSTSTGTYESKTEAPWNNPNMRWVCENHPDKEWETECECGAGMPDPKLYDHLGQPRTPISE